MSYLRMHLLAAGIAAGITAAAGLALAALIGHGDVVLAICGAVLATLTGALSWRADMEARP